MSDDLERQLDEFYRKLDGSARRVEARWKSTPTTSESRTAAWIGAGVAAAAAILLVISALRTEPKRPAEPAVVTAPPQVPETPPTPAPVAPAPAPRAPRPEPVDAPKPETPRPPEPRPEPPAPPAPVPLPPTPPPAPRPEPPKREETTPAKPPRAIALRETEGSFDLGDKPIRGKQKDLQVKEGDRLRVASTPVRITLADDRVVLLAPRTVVELRPEEKRLAFAMEQGDLLADLIGPGPEIRVLARACEITPLGTVFGVKVDGGKVLVTVEKGRVDVQTPKGKATLKPAESIQASEDGTMGAPSPADFRSMAWARSQRAAELSLFAEDFSKPGTWTAEVDRGVAKAVAKPGSGATLHYAVDKGFFEAPVRGSITIVCRADRAGKFKVQLYSPDQKTTYTKQNINIMRGDWRPVTINFDEFVPSDKSRPARLPAGSTVSDLLIMYGEEGEPGNFWVDSIKITEVRP